MFWKTYAKKKAGTPHKTRVQTEPPITFWCISLQASQRERGLVCRQRKRATQMQIYFHSCCHPVFRSFSPPRPPTSTLSVSASYVTEKTERSLLTPISQITPSISSFTKWVKFCMHFLKNYVSGKPTPDPNYFELHFTVEAWCCLWNAL